MQSNTNIASDPSSRAAVRGTGLFTCVAVMAALALLAPPLARAANDAACATLLQAQTALQHAPTFLEIVKTSSHPAFKIIVTPTRMYSQDPDGNWTYAEFSEATRSKLIHLFGKSKLTNCSKLRTEKIDGQTADVYSVTYDPRFGKKNTVTIWVSQSSGLPLKNEGDVHKLFGGTDHMVQTFSYTNVQVPANAKEEINMDKMFGGH